MYVYQYSTTSDMNNNDSALHSTSYEMQSMKDLGKVWYKVVFMHEYQKLK